MLQLLPMYIYALFERPPFLFFSFLFFLFDFFIYIFHLQLWYSFLPSLMLLPLYSPPTHPVAVPSHHVFMHRTSGKHHFPTKREGGFEKSIPMRTVVTSFLPLSAATSVLCTYIFVYAYGMACYDDILSLKGTGPVACSP